LSHFRLSWSDAARMATTELTAETTGSGNRAGIYLAFLLVFTLG
jgi:hypothetical protein